MSITTFKFIELSSQAYRGYTIYQTPRGMWIEQGREFRMNVPKGESWLWARIAIDRMLEGFV